MARAGTAGQLAGAATAALGAGGAVVEVVDVDVDDVDVVPDWRTSAWFVPPLLQAAVIRAASDATSTAERTGPWWRKYGPAVARLTPTCVWRISPELVLALQDRFGDPVDAYVNGSQVWLRDDGPGGVTIEWRLHPVAGYERPEGVDTYDVFPATALALAQDVAPPVPCERLWDGLEAFAAYGDELEPATLGNATTEALGVPANACGVVDHQRIGDEWEKTGRATSIVDALLAQLTA